MMKAGTLRKIAGLLLAAALIAGCGGGDDDTVTGGDDPHEEIFAEGQSHSEYLAATVAADTMHYDLSTCVPCHGSSFDLGGSAGTSCLTCHTEDHHQIGVVWQDAGVDHRTHPQAVELAADRGSTCIRCHVRTDADPRPAFGGACGRCHTAW